MSTNPFRRSSLKGPGGSSAGFESSSIPSASDDTTDAGTATPPVLSVNTKVGSTTQKHVNFASPPAIPISPVSYPPSPESTRFSPAYGFAKPVSPAPVDYSAAIQTYPFRTEVEPDEDDGAIEQARENAKANANLIEPIAEVSKQDAIKNTLNRFASAPKRPVVPTHGSDGPQSSALQRQTMDVDAFKRLLLTGDSKHTRTQDESVPGAAPIASFVMNDNSSATDTASMSQRSLFDPGPPTDDSPRSSTEGDSVEIEPLRQSLAHNDVVGARKRPPPPTPRHGKLLKEEVADESTHGISQASTDMPTVTARQPPTPPLARRRSGNASASLPSSSQKSTPNDPERTISSDDTRPRAPLPPRPRRPAPPAERRPSSELPTTLEEPDFVGSSPSSSRRTSDSRPAPPPARNSFKRVSTGPGNLPPAPPPRRARGLSKSSVDGQGLPVNISQGDKHPEVDAGDTSQTGIDGRIPSSGTNTHDIMAEIAALQREVEAARRKASR